jgi:hypothetical protein
MYKDISNRSLHLMSSISASRGGNKDSRVHGCRSNLTSLEADGAGRQIGNLNYLAGFPGLLPKSKRWTSGTCISCINLLIAGRENAPDGSEEANKDGSTIVSQSCFVCQKLEFQSNVNHLHQGVYWEIDQSKPGISDIMRDNNLIQKWH